MAIIRTTIGVRSNDNVNISSVGAPVGDAYVVTLASAPPSDTVIGDTLSDEKATTPNIYLISDISGADVTVRDVLGAGEAPSAAGASQAFTNRTYADVNAANADFDDTSIYSNSDIAEVALCEAITTGTTQTIGSLGDTVGLTKAVLIGHENYRHDGNIGSTTGKIIHTGTSSAVSMSNAGVPTVQVSWLLIERAPVTTYRYGGINITPSSGGGNYHIDHCIIYSDDAGTFTTTSLRGIYASSGFGGNVIIDECIVANISANSGADGVGVWLSYCATTISNCTVYGCPEEGIKRAGTGTLLARNCICSDNGTDFSHDSTWTTGTNYNVSTDLTAPGATVVTGESSADLFEDAASDDFHLNATSEAIGIGGNYEGETVHGYSGFGVDIDGDARQSSPTAWDVGADFYVAGPMLAVPATPAIAFAILGL